MPIRSTPLVNGQIYHVLNRGNGAIPIFKLSYDYRRFLEIITYYQNSKPPLRFSKYLQLPATERTRIIEELIKKGDFWVEIIAFCLMPNHFHFILKQLKDAGIFNFMSLSQNSYARYFNLKNKRKGGIFEDRFKAIIIETNEQLLHLSRYIHLNPYSSYIVKDFPSLLKYPYSSLGEYLGLTQTQLCKKEIVLDQFTGPKDYKEFLANQADYQRSLDQIKHQILEI